ncbi:SRPBCC family protein [Streptomyces sp. H10-C2]|uniref:SRPBCC family protein n=1 Tax=unclassified Streptomyces TaxID=2593676 RepID=UPI0024BA3560|nr:MULTISPECIES: SRPBCC family protein [unclassified Streptomyces]MDJ0340857.1 SRPBCC family protein [Streptomyces sp. PH10-H1]MDJ0371697.1 SRPBCC family protein [Streptomyces sp. H10-C2]
MAQVEATTQRVIEAEPERVYDALADYAGTRKTLLPEQFSEYEVREGGSGVGTVVHWKLQATSKRVRDCLFDVTAPTAGQLVEADRNSSMVTTWTVTPAGEGRSKVVSATTWDGAGGIGGFFERTFAPKGLGRIYDAVLAKLAAEVESGK